MKSIVVAKIMRRPANKLAKLDHAMLYNEALFESDLETLYARRHAACVKLLNLILDDPNH